MTFIECPNKLEEVLTDRLDTKNNVKYITVSDKESNPISFDGEKILFSKLYAWCVKQEIVPGELYKDWVQVDLRGEYLLYGLKVGGNNVEKAVIPKDFKFYYSFDARKWAAYDGGNVSVC